MSSSSNSLFFRHFSLGSKDHFLVVKGLASCLILLSYCLAYFFALQLSFLSDLGCSLFLLCSGFGLAESFRHRNGLFHFWENKMVKLWLPSLCVVLAEYAIAGKYILDWIDSNPLGLRDWFLYLLFAQYAIFWIACYFLKKDYSRMALVLCGSLAIWIMIPHDQIAGNVLSFPAGMIFSTLQLKKPIRKMSGGLRFLLCTVLVSFGLLFYVLYVMQGNSMGGLLCHSVSGALLASFVILLIYFAQPLRIFNVFAPVGTVSYSLYLLFPIILDLIEPDSSWRIIVLEFALLIAASIGLTVCMELLVHWNKSLRRTKVHIKGRIEE